MIRFLRGISGIFFRSLNFQAKWIIKIFEEAYKDLLMKRVLIITMLFLFVGMIFSLKSINAGSNRDIVIAVPDFIISEGISGMYADILAETLQEVLRESGRISVRDMMAIKEGIENSNLPVDMTLYDCLADEACLKEIGRELAVDYVSYSRISRISESYLVRIELIPVSDAPEIPHSIRGVNNEEDLPGSVEAIGENIIVRFPLKGEILAVVQNGRNVIIDLGERNKLEAGDEFFVIRETVVEGFKDTRKIGTLTVTEIKEEKSKAEVKSGRGDIQKGDFIVLNEEDLLKKIEEERLKEEAALAEIKEEYPEKEDAEEDKSDARKFAECASFFRIGYGGFGLVKFGEEYLNDYYNKGFGVFADIFLYRLRTTAGGNGFDFYTRYYYRQYEMTEDSFEDFQLDYAGVQYGISELKIHSFDIGGRLIFGGYFWFSRIDLYCTGAYRQAYIVESSENGVENSYLSYGIVGGGGMEIALLRRVALFGEYNIGYTTVGDNKDNIDGHQVLFGISLRTEHI